MFVNINTEVEIAIKYNFLTKALLRGKIYGRIIAKNMVSSFFVPPVCNDVFVKNYRSC